MTTYQARFLRGGDIVNVPESGPDIVRRVTIVLEMSSGVNLSFPSNQVLEILDPEEVPGRDETAGDALPDQSLVSLTDNSGTS